MSTEANGHPTETSPLLGKQGPQLVEPSNGIAPDGAVTNGVVEGSGGIEDEDGGDVERQVSAEDRAKQYEGMPEMKKNMKYM